MWSRISLALHAGYGSIRDKDKILGEAVWQDYLRKTGRNAILRL